MEKQKREGLTATEAAAYCWTNREAEVFDKYGNKCRVNSQGLPQLCDMRPLGPSGVRIWWNNEYAFQDSSAPFRIATWRDDPESVEDAMSERRITALRKCIVERQHAEDRARSAFRTSYGADHCDFVVYQLVKLIDAMLNEAFAKRGE